MNNLSGATYSWPCEYCKEKFIDVRSVINHELYICSKNPKFNYKEKDLKDNQLNINKCQKLNYQENR